MDGMISIYYLVSFGLGAVNVALWIVLLVGLWRLVKAQESMAESLRYLLDQLTARNEIARRPPNVSGGSGS